MAIQKKKRVVKISLPKEFSSNKNLSILFIFYIIISPILTLISSIGSHPDVELSILITISIILVVIIIILSIPIFLILNKESKRTSEFEKEKREREKEKWELDKQFFSMDKIGNALPELLKLEPVQNFLAQYLNPESLKKEVDKASEKSKKDTNNESKN